MKGTLTAISRGVAVVGAAALLTTASASATEPWRFTAVIYGWVPTIENEQPSGQKFDISKSDILENLDFTFQGSFTARRGPWSLGADFVYFDLSNKDQVPITSELELSKIELEGTDFAPSAGYRVREADDGYVELYIGGRYLKIQPTLTFRTVASALPASVSESRSGSVWDAIAGVRGVHPLGDRWYLHYAADGGTGESDWLLNLRTGLGCRFQRLNVLAAWRYQYWDFGDGKALRKFSLNGPAIGMSLTF